MVVAHLKNDVSKFMSFLKLKCLEEQKTSNLSYYSLFVLGPLNFGQGITIGNAIRRTLLANIPGVAITSVQIVGAEHEYSTLLGVRESVLEILYNLKQIVFTSSVELQNTKTGFLQKKGPCVIYAKDLNLPSSITVVEPEQYIATLEYDGELNIKFVLAQGEGFKIQSPAEYKVPIELPIDSVFMPVQKVNYKVQVEKAFQAYKEYIFLEIWTNGSLSPHQALQEAANKLQVLFENLQNVPVPENKLFGEWNSAIRRDLVSFYPLLII